MAEPTVKINVSNPTEVARETLRRLAMRRIAPTPDNYQTLYDEIVGVPTAPANKATAETCLLYTSPSPRDKRQSRMPSSA